MNWVITPTTAKMASSTGTWLQSPTTVSSQAARPSAGARCAVALQDQDVAGAQPRLRELLAEPALLAPQAQHQHTPTAAEVDLRDRAPGEIRRGRDDRLHQPVGGIAVAVIGGTRLV